MHWHVLEGLCSQGPAGHNWLSLDSPTNDSPRTPTERIPHQHCFAPLDIDGPPRSLTTASLSRAERQHSLGPPHLLCTLCICHRWQRHSVPCASHADTLDTYFVWTHCFQWHVPIPVQWVGRDWGRGTKWVLHGGETKPVQQGIEPLVSKIQTKMKLQCNFFF